MLTSQLRHRVVIQIDASTARPAIDVVAAKVLHDEETVTFNVPKLYLCVIAGHGRLEIDHCLVVLLTVALNPSH